MRISGAWPSTSAPSPRRTSAMIGTSMMSGTLVRVVVPSASSAAAITLSTLFLAPVTVTSPVSWAPPYTRKQSTRPLYGTGEALPAAPGCHTAPDKAECSHDPDVAQTLAPAAGCGRLQPGAD